MASNNLWKSTGLNATIGNRASYSAYINLSGFSALPTSFRLDGDFSTILNTRTFIWTSLSTDANNARFYVIGDYSKKTGASVRCLKD